MDEILDIVWLKIVDLVLLVVRGMDIVVAPFNVLGPAAVIFLLTLLIVCLTKLFKRAYTTKRFQVLKKEFEHWSKVRKAAMNIEDPEKGKRMARNIDQAKLNKVYYDYFFEGFLNNILTTILPIFLMAAYVNETYNPEKLQKLFGRSHVFGIPGTGDDPILVGALFWYVLSLILVHILWAVGKRALKNKNESKAS
jgi:hypothetical protein